jgi:hypothetical protein
MRIITHACEFASEAEAFAALPEYLVANEEAGPVDWDRSRIDAPIEIMIGTGAFVTDPETGQQIEIKTPKPGYRVNLALDELRTDLSGLVGVWEAPGMLLFGEHPVTPQRVFAACCPREDGEGWLGANIFGPS